MMQVEQTISNDGPVRGAHVIEVIQIQALRGQGTEADVFRIVTQYWSLDGQLLAETDIKPPTATFTYTTGFEPTPPPDTTKESK